MSESTRPIFNGTTNPKTSAELRPKGVPSNGKTPEHLQSNGSATPPNSNTPIRPANISTQISQFIDHALTFNVNKFEYMEYITGGCPC